MRDHAEQHQENGHRHHDHVMTNAARGGETRVSVGVLPGEQGGALFARARRVINLLLIKALAAQSSSPSPSPRADVQPAPVVLHQEEKMLREKRKRERGTVGLKVVCLLSHPLYSKVQTSLNEQKMSYKRHQIRYDQDDEE